MISKKPENKNLSFYKTRFFYKNARSGFSDLLVSLNFTARDVLLVPSFIGENEWEGSGVFDPIRQHKINYEFYRIKRNFRVDEEGLIEKLCDPYVKALLVIHYFGFAWLNLEKIIDICEKNNIFVIEDCAHALGSSIHSSLLGEFGDASFVSLHKLLPLSDGGFLQINNGSHEINTDRKCSISLQSLQFLNMVDLIKVNKKRVDNYRYLSNKLKIFEGINILVNKIKKGIVPLNLPLIILKNKRDEIYEKLNKKKLGIICLYRNLIPEINDKEYPEAHYLSSHIINLPIHQDVTRENMDLVVQTLRSFFGTKE